MSIDKISLTAATDQVIEKYGDKEVNGLLFVFWEEDNTVGAAYAGSPLEGDRIVELGLNGSRAVLHQWGQQVQAAMKAQDPADLKLVAPNEAD